MDKQEIKNINDPVHLGAILDRYERAINKRKPWEAIVQECYTYTYPQRSSSSLFGYKSGNIKTDLYDATATDAVDQLAASLLGNLTPAWTQWFGFKAGPELSKAESEKITPLLENIAKKIQSHFDRSNFSVEIHQCFLDLIIGGTATLYVEETLPGALSSLKFSAIPIQEVALEEDGNGFLKGSFRHLNLTLSQIKSRYKGVELPLNLTKSGGCEVSKTFKILETVIPQDNVYEFYAILIEESNPFLLSTGYFDQSPAISFRWMKSPGEIYGRSPVMKALPDIKTANKVVELILKNASIAVTGIWQADDDGVLNPANIELVPGAIIPKAVGSQGLRALDMPGRFDVSELILKDLRQKIRDSLLSDKLVNVIDKRMTATEVLERSSQMALLLGATYGRLQSELLTPLILRAFNILKRRGEIPDIDLDGRTVVIDYRSPLAKAQSQKDIQNIFLWLDSVKSIGGSASQFVDVEKTVEYIADTLGVPKDLVAKNNTSLEYLVSSLPNLEVNNA